MQGFGLGRGAQWRKADTAFFLLIWRKMPSNWLKFGDHVSLSSCKRILHFWVKTLSFLWDEAWLAWERACFYTRRETMGPQWVWVNREMNNCQLIWGRSIPIKSHQTEVLGPTDIRLQSCSSEHQRSRCCYVKVPLCCLHSISSFSGFTAGTQT